ncbi:MAG: hypothetical protein ABIP14_01520 [Blastocatellia bacterium]
MANKAVRRAVIQIAILITLAVTANAIKPFSPGNVVMHTLSAAQSLSFVLPNAAAERIEQANYLAQAYGKSLFDGNGSNSVWPPPNSFQSGQLALMAASLSIAPSAEAEIKDVEVCPGKKSAPTKRQVRHLKPGGVRGDREEAAGSAKAKAVVRPTMQSVAMVEPALYTNGGSSLMGGRIIPASVRFSMPVSCPELIDCAKAEVKIVKLTATPRELPNLPTVKVSLLLLPQTVTLVSRCREEKRIKIEVTEEAEEVESSAETTVGPEEQSFGETFADPMAMPSIPAHPECPPMQ